MVHCARLLCDVGISCAHILIYPEWADPSSIVVAFHYNLQIPRNTLIPVCLPFAFAFQLAQSQSALRKCRAIVFEKGSKKKGGCVKVEEEARVLGELSSKCMMSGVAFPSLHVKCVGVVYAQCWQRTCLYLSLFLCGVMTSNAQSKKLLLIVLRIVVRGGACELCILLTHILRVKINW